MRIRSLLFATIVFYAFACWSQTTAGAPTTQALNAMNANNICRIYFAQPKSGASTQLEQARQKHMQFHKSQNDTWTWNTYLIETGMNTGTYVTSTCGHAWKDFDDWEKKMGKADAADAAAGMGPLQEHSWNGFYIYRSDMSLAPANQPPAPLTSVTIYHLRAGTADDFTGAVTKINDALRKQQDWPKTSGWLQLANGGDAPEFVLLSSRQNWADFAPLSKSVRDVLNDAYGKEGADALLKTLRESTAHVATEAASFRSDLSYLPGK